ncbi:MAG: SHOCT domain-containing protein [Bacteroidota bacterium]
MHSQVHRSLLRPLALWSLLLAMVSLSLAACDATSPDALTTGAAPSTFSATVSSPESAVKTLTGTAASAGDPGLYEGLFQNQAFRDEAGNVYVYTHLTLRAETGEAIVLGHFSEGRPVPGRFGIEAGRNLEAPFGFFAIYDATGARALATGGSVTLDTTGRTLSGSFDLAFDGEVSIIGSFTAAPSNEGGQAEEDGDRGDEEGDRGEGEEDPGDDDRDNTECDRLLEELRALYEAGEITREEVAERLEAAGCGEDETGDRGEEGEGPREEGEGSSDDDRGGEGEEPGEDEEDRGDEDEDRP